MNGGRGAGRGGSQIDPPPLGKTTFKKPSFIRFNLFWIMTAANTIFRWFYKTQNIIFKNTITFVIPNFDIRVIPFINVRRNE